MQDELPEGEEEEEEDDDDDDEEEEEEEEEEDEMERYGSKPAKRPRSDFVIEEAGQLNYTTIFDSIVIIDSCKIYMHAYVFVFA